MKRNCKGFTLLELMVVLAIFLIIFAVSIPLVSGYREKAQASECTKNRNSVKEQLATHYMVYQTPFSKTFASIDTEDMCPCGGVYSLSGMNVICSVHNAGELSAQVSDCFTDVTTDAAIASDLMTVLNQLIPEINANFGSAIINTVSGSDGEEYAFISASDLMTTVDGSSLNGYLDSKYSLGLSARQIERIVNSGVKIFINSDRTSINAVVYFDSGKAIFLYPDGSFHSVSSTEAADPAQQGHYAAHPQLMD